MKLRRRWIRTLLLIFGFALAIYVVLDSLAFKVPIFGFHSIFDRRTPDELPSRAPYLDYAVQDLETVLTTLIRGDYWFLDSNDFHDYFLTRSRTIPPARIGQKPVMLTFDDGYENVRAYVLPLLEKFERQYDIKIPIVLFLNPAFFDKNNPKRPQKYLTCEGVREGLTAGFYDVQSAGFQHVNLTQLNERDIEFDIAEARQKLQECVRGLDHSEDVARHFAYPYNRVNGSIERLVKQYHESAYRYDDRMQMLGWTQRPYRISRLGIQRNDSPQRLLRLARRASTLPKSF
ncbi:MAG: polysaccharide deacetylase family protein [Cyanobacteria bacterium SID2]|nr:polysaccharide deacetylase family protein [Cyanobacteria bacterium SID2]